MNRVELQVVSNVLGSQCPRAGACLLRAVERAAHAGANASRKRTRRLPSTGWHSLSSISSLRQSRRSSTRKSIHHTGRKGGRRLVVDAPIQLSAKDRQESIATQTRRCGRGVVTACMLACLMTMRLYPLPCFLVRRRDTMALFLVHRPPRPESVEIGLARQSRLAEDGA